MDRAISSRLKQLLFPVARDLVSSEIRSFIDLMNRSTIAAVATPPGTGAIALIRVSGPMALTVASKVFAGGTSTGDCKPRVQRFGRILDADGSFIDEVLLTVFQGPHSFTGEDVVEITCHGGVVVTRRVIEALLAAGAEPAAPGEFTERAFLNGKMDLTQAEAIMDIISAQTDLALKAAGEQLSGRLGREIETIRMDLIGLLAHLEAYIDFPEEDIDPDSMTTLLDRVGSVDRRISALLATADQGRILREGIRTVICGAPNAGKSSLLNRLLGYERAIVNQAAGTTRDTIEEMVNMRGLPLRLIDTAGLRDVDEAVEREGIERSRAQIAAAELVLHVVDGSRNAVGVEYPEVPPHARLIRILNKSDLPIHPDWDGAEGFPLSCLDENSVEHLRGRIFDLIIEGTPLASANLVAINSRHQYCLKRALEEVTRARQGLEEGISPEYVAMELRSALDAVGDVVGRTDIEEILGEIFSQFCIGK